MKKTTLNFGDFTAWTLDTFKDFAFQDVFNALGSIASIEPKEDLAERITKSIELLNGMGYKIKITTSDGSLETEIYKNSKETRNFTLAEFGTRTQYELVCYFSNKVIEAMVTEDHMKIYRK